VKARTRIFTRDVWNLRGQITAAALVVACGIAAFVAMRGTYESLLSARSDYYRSLRFADVFVRLVRAPISLEGRIAEIPGVANVRTRVVKEITLDVPGLDEPATGRLVGIPEHPHPILNDALLRRGRWVEPGRDDEVMASEAFAEANGLLPGDRVGAVLNGRWKSLTIVGVAISPEYIYEIGGGAILPDNRRFGVLWMGEGPLGAAFDMEGAFNDVALSMSAGAVESDVIARVDLLLARFGGFGAHGRDEQLSHRFISDEIAQNRVTSTYIPAIFLAIAAFLLHMVLSRLVSMQRTQIGLLKAFGYGDSTIGAHYLGLAGITVLAGAALGSAAGCALGSSLTALYRDFYRFPRLDFSASPRLLALALVISSCAAGAGALGALRRAAALPPAEAMRPEAPASFRAGALEATGVARLLPSSAAMIARNILRRGWKSAVSVLGIASAAGLLVVGGYFLDAIDFMMTVQFDRVQRADATILFVEPVSEDAKTELTRLPGVIRAEPFRSVAARLRFEHRSRRVELTGLARGSELYVPLDSLLRPVAVPPAGLLLTRKLAEVLGVVPGESISVEVLEASRPVRDVQLAAVVDELVGVRAYMSASALSRLMGEQGSVSGANLRVDPVQAPALYSLLKRLPAVRGVVIREAVVRSVREILQRSLVIPTVVNALFASIIAFGVVYNGARIALSERGNELASLRVLGFTRREVSILLLGEQAVITFVAIPVGFLMGIGVCRLLADRLSTELYRLQMVLTPRTFGFALAVIVFAATSSGVIVARRLHRMDLISVLKTRE
jgi:putative ABC transport system permease protein